MKHRTEHGITFRTGPEEIFNLENVTFKEGQISLIKSDDNTYKMCIDHKERKPFIEVEQLIEYLLEKLNN